MVASGVTKPEDSCEYVVDAFGKEVKCRKTAENDKHMFAIWYYWNDGAPAECPINTGTEEVGKMTTNKRFEKLLNRFGQTASDLPIAELGPAYREYYLESLVERMEIALQIASDQIDNIRKTAQLMTEDYRPVGEWVYQHDHRYNLGYKDASRTILRYIDNYSECGEEGKE